MIQLLPTLISYADLGMAIMISLVWLRIGEDQNRINDRLSAHFCMVHDIEFAIRELIQRPTDGVAFLSFMSVAGVPAFLEHRTIFL